MRRTLLFVALAFPALLVGVARAHDPGPARLVTADEPGTTSSTVELEPSTSTTEAQDATTTSPPKSTSTSTSTSTTEVHRSTTTTTSTTAPRHAEPASLTISCASADGNPTVSCDWDGVPTRTTRLVVMRERPGTSSQPLASTNDTSTRHFDDTSAELGVTYVCRVSAYDGDAFVETSNPVRIKSGGGTPDAPPAVATMTLRCEDIGTTVHCAWGQGPAGTVGYRLLRPIDDRHGRVVAQTGANTFEASEENVPPGAWHYLVQALDANGHVLASGQAEVDCCTSSADQR